MPLNFKILRSFLRINHRKSVTLSKGIRGKVQISLHALESLAQRRIRAEKEIQKAVVTAVPMAVGVGMHIQLTVSRNVNALSLVNSVENAIRDEILTITGIRLRKVQVEIRKISSGRPRVR